MTEQSCCDNPAHGPVAWHCDLSASAVKRIMEQVGRMIRTELPSCQRGLALSLYPAYRAAVVDDRQPPSALF